MRRNRTFKILAAAVFSGALALSLSACNKEASGEGNMEVLNADYFYIGSTSITGGDDTGDHHQVYAGTHQVSLTFRHCENRDNEPELNEWTTTPEMRASVRAEDLRYHKICATAYEFMIKFPGIYSMFGMAWDTKCENLNDKWIRCTGKDMDDGAGGRVGPVRYVAYVYDGKLKGFQIWQMNPQTWDHQPLPGGPKLISTFGVGRNYVPR